MAGRRIRTPLDLANPELIRSRPLVPLLPKTCTGAVLLVPHAQECGEGFAYPTLELKEFQKIPLAVGSGLVAFFQKKHPLNVGGVNVVGENVPEGAKIK
jgi:hypothetical protein